MGMQRTIKDLIRSCINALVNVGSKTAIGRYVFEEALNRAMDRTWSIQHGGIDLAFAVPNSLNHFRIDTFATKEPETLEWIDGIPEGSVFWDIGANVGLYTCYAAKARRCRVFAFEPSVFNLELLARNIFLNGITEQATIVPLPLNDVLAINTLNMTTTEWGGALSTFGQVYGQDGRVLRKIFEFRTIGISMLDAVESLKIPQPEYIKMDVDGIEHLILKGGPAILANVKGVLVEIDEDFEKQAVESAHYLSKAGLVLKEKRHADMFEHSIYKNSYNQTWHRP
jgi:FkbM family methyltransferase